MTEGKKRKQQIINDRDAGMTHQQIADKHGVSRQYVSQVCATHNPSQFRAVKKEHCIYPNLRAWMNKNRCSRAELARRMGYSSEPCSSLRLGDYMMGRFAPRKPMIDKMLEVTGMTYEKLFALEDDDGK